MSIRHSENVSSQNQIYFYLPLMFNLLNENVRPSDVEKVPHSHPRDSINGNMWYWLAECLSGNQMQTTSWASVVITLCTACSLHSPIWDKVQRRGNNQSIIDGDCETNFCCKDSSTDTDIQSQYNPHILQEIWMTNTMDLDLWRLASKDVHR